MADYRDELPAVRHGEDTFTLIYDEGGSHEGSSASRRSFELLRSQINTQTLSRMFSIEPDTVWLSQQYGRKVFFPDRSTSQFDITPDIMDGEAFYVHGTPHSANSVLSQGVPIAIPTNSAGVAQSPSSILTPSRPIFQKKGAQYSVKIIQASVKRQAGKVEFIQKSQTFVDIKEDCANVNYITNIIQRKWGENYVLVTNDGLTIEDCSGTNGLKFWKVGSRKIFAVKKEDVHQNTDGNEEIELNPPPQKKEKTMQEIRGMRSEMQSLFKMTNRMSIPSGLYKLLEETFICQICRATPARPPLIFARCCKRLLGCQPCVDKWYHDEDQQMMKVCPVCRSERAYSETCIIKGLDEFLEAIVPILENP